MYKYVSFKLNPVMFMYPSCVPFMDNINELLCQPLSQQSVPQPGHLDPVIILDFALRARAAPGPARH